MRYRLISFRHFSAFMNMAIDEAIMENVRAEKCLPTIRLYGWQPSAISIGYFQGLHQEVNLDACRQEGVDVVRRMTGGGAVYHDCDGEITYSLIAPARFFPDDIIESYRQICAYLTDALRRLGIEATFQPINDIAVGDQKISGNAQTRRGGVLLQHGTVLYTVNVEKMFSLLNVSEKKMDDKLIKSVKKRVTSITAFKQVSREDVALAMEQAFSQGNDITREDYSAQELQRAAELSAKYAGDAWVAMR